MNKHLFLSSLLGISLLLETVNVAPVYAQEASPDQACETALNNAESLLVNDRHLWISSGNASNLNESEYQNFPYQHPVHLSLGISGNDAENVMSSPQLLTSIVTTIMDGCQAIGLVSIVLDGTDWEARFGRIGNQVRAFECIDPDDSYSTPWGYVVCI